jgi:hypothetical protein
MKTVILYGPPASGKTRNADKIAEHFGCHRIVDNFNYPYLPVKDYIYGALHITCCKPDLVPPDSVCIEIKDALKLVS